MTEAVRTVYAVTSGEYENWHVDCVFETREDAEQVAAGLRFDWTSYDVEEFDLYAAGEAANFRSRTTYSAQATVFRDGSASSSGIREWDSTEFEHGADEDVATEVRLYGVLAARPVSRHKDKWTITADAATAEAAREALLERMTAAADELRRGLNPETGEPLPPEARHPDSLTMAEFRALRYGGAR